MWGVVNATDVSAEENRKLCHSPSIAPKKNLCHSKTKPAQFLVVMAKSYCVNEIIHLYFNDQHKTQNVPFYCTNPKYLNKELLFF